MSDYISRESVLALADDFELTLPDDEIFFSYIPVKDVKKLPAADVRPVVLCRDCKHADFAGMGNGTVWCDKMERAMQEEDFCAYGER